MGVINVEIYSIAVLLILISNYIIKFRRKFNTASLIWLILAISTLAISMSNIFLTFSETYFVRLIALVCYLLFTLICSLFVYIYVKYVYINQNINIKKEISYVFISIIACIIIAIIYVLLADTYIIHSLNRKFFNQLLVLSIIPNVLICINYIYDMQQKQKIIDYKIVITLMITAIALTFDILNDSLFFVSATFTLTTLILYINKHERLLNTDPLTGLSNKRSLEAFIQALHANISVAVYSMDIDRFKQINDTHGHLKGDWVLKNVAEVLRNSARDRDLVIRNGGDEFLILAVISKKEDGEIILNRIKENLDIYYKNNEIKTTVSVGWGVFETDTKTTIEDFKKFLKKIDKKMYLAKEINHKKMNNENI